MTGDDMLKTAPDKPSLSNDSVTVELNGRALQVKFTARTLIRLENTWGSHEAYLTDLETKPTATLAALVLIMSNDKTMTEDQAIDALEDVDLAALKASVEQAWRLANPEPNPNAVPTTGQ